MSDQWYYQHDSAMGGGEPVGPMNAAQLKASIRAKKFRKKDLVMSPQATNSQWLKVSTVPKLVALFDAVAQDAKAERKQIKAQRLAESEVDREKRKLEKLARDNKAQRLKEQAIIRNRGTLIQKMFGASKPSPYFGFDFQKAVIAVFIVLVACGSIFYAVMTISVSIGLSEGSASVIFLGIFSGVAGLITGFLTIVSLIFFRNVIDWMIDMENHAKETRELLKRDFKGDNSQ